MEALKESRYPLIRPRADGEPGHLRVIETDEAYVEADGSDIRVKRVYVMGPNGEVERTFLMDEMGARFVDNLGYQDRIDVV